MGFFDDFTSCITGKDLPPELLNVLPDAKTALSFAAQLIKGETIVAALVAIGVGAEAAAAVAEVVGAITVGAIIGAIMGCAAGAALASNDSASDMQGVLASLDSSDVAALQGPLADAGFNPTSAAA